MHALVFGLRELPDLTLVKYSNVGARGVDGVLEAHQGFLRLFSHRPATSLHLLYTYDPSAQDGERLAVNLLVCDVRSTPDLEDVQQLVSSSSLSPFFDFVPLTTEQGESPLINLDRLPPKESAVRLPLFLKMLGPGCGIDARLPKPTKQDEGKSSKEDKQDSPQFGALATATWKWMASLAKRGQFVVQQPPSHEVPNGFFTLPAYEQEDSGRLLALMRLMEALGESMQQPLAYRVDLYPTDRMDTLRHSLPLPYLKSQQLAQMGRRDYVLEGVERSYDDSLRTLEASPLFLANVFSFAPTSEVARALLDAASSEAVKKGGVSIALFESPQGDPWTVESFLTRDHWSRRRISSDGMTVLAPRTEIVSGQRIPRPGYVHVDTRAEKYPHADMQCLFTLSEIAPYFRFPTLNDGEAVQLRKETAPRPITPEHSIYLGRDNSGHDAYFETRLLSRHAFISGVPGSGKTNTMHHLATTLINMGVPVLVFEPAKHEYRALLNARLKSPVCLLCPGGEEAFPLRLNPFQIPYGVTVGHHIGRLVEVFEGSFPLEGALPFLLDRAIEAVYAAHGWDPKDRSDPNSSKTWPTLSELYDQMEVELKKEDYGSEIRGNLASAIRMRIGGLTRRELGELFDVAESVYPPSTWLNMSAIIELEALGRSEANFFTLLLMVLIRESLMVNPNFQGNTPVRHVIFVEEAHNLVGPEADYVKGEHADPKMAATAFLSDMLREVRAYGEGIIIADQLPTAIAPEVLKNTSLKVALRMTSEDDRDLLGSMMSASAVQLERLAVSNPGDGLVLYEGLQRPFELRLAEWLGVPDTPEYIANEEERQQSAISWEAKKLHAKLMDESSPWYISLRRAVCAIDTRTFLAQLDRIDKKWAEVLECCENRRKLDRARKSEEIDTETYVAEGQKIIERLAKVTGTTTANLRVDKVFDAYKAAVRKYSSRLRSWHGFGVVVEPINEPTRIFDRPFNMMEETMTMDKTESVNHLRAVQAHAAYLRRLLRLANGCTDWLTSLHDSSGEIIPLEQLNNELIDAEFVLKWACMDAE